MQRSAERDVELLESAADSEQRHTGFQRVPRDRDRQRIAVRVAQSIRILGLVAVMVRLDIAVAAGEHDAVDPVHEFVEREVLGEHGDDHWNRVSCLDNGFQVFFPCLVVGVGLMDATVRRHADNRFRAHMGTNPGTPLRSED